VRLNWSFQHAKGFTVRDAREEDLEAARALMLQVLEEDLGYGYRPEWHWDTDDLTGVYLEHPRQALFVACERGRVIGTTAVRNQGPKHPPHPEWLAQRYSGPTVAQLMRVYVARDHRRRGVGAALVELAHRFVRLDAGYTTLYLHTENPQAIAFWDRLATVVYDTRPDGGGTVHYEVALKLGALPFPMGGQHSTGSMLKG
jgi:ribosomal protein S18 acetylase RimI-like enzyme